MVIDNVRRKVFVAHLKEVERLFKNDEDFLTTVYSNRILSDSLIMDDLNWGLIGFIIRSMTLDYIRFKTSNSGKTDSKHISEVRAPGVDLLTALKEYTSEEKNASLSLWNLFVKYKNVFRQYQHVESESESYYSDNLNENYTAYVSEWMTGFLDASKDYLYLTNNNLLKGIGNEIERISNLTGYNLKTILLSSSLTSMDWYLDYLKQFGNYDPKIYKTIIEENFIQEVEELLLLMKVEDSPVEKFSNFIWENLKNWRRLFIVFMDLPSGSTRMENKIALPPEFKDKLTEILSKAVKKEIGMK